VSSAGALRITAQIDEPGSLGHHLDASRSPEEPRGERRHIEDRVEGRRQGETHGTAVVGVGGEVEPFATVPDADLGAHQGLTRVVPQGDLSSVTFLRRSEGFSGAGGAPVGGEEVFPEVPGQGSSPGVLDAGAPVGAGEG